MKNPSNNLITFSATGILLISVIFQACLTTNKIVEENDLVYSTKRVALKSSYYEHTRRSPLISLEQSIVKEIKANNETSYKVYDILSLTSSSFTLENKAFMIIDNDVFPMPIDNKEYENAKTITENRQNVLTADSTTVSVVTGYSENDRKITRFSYMLSDEVIARVKNSNQVLFRYYSGPSMLTVRLKEKNLKKLKGLIDRT